MQTAGSEIWTLVADSISYDDNCYTMSACLDICEVQNRTKKFSIQPKKEIILFSKCTTEESKEGILFDFYWF